MDVIELYALFWLNYARGLLTSFADRIVGHRSDHGCAAILERTEHVVSIMVVNGKVILIAEDFEYSVRIILFLRAFNHYN